MYISVSNISGRCNLILKCLLNCEDCDIHTISLELSAEFMDSVMFKFLEMSLFVHLFNTPKDCQCQ